MREAALKSPEFHGHPSTSPSDSYLLLPYHWIKGFMRSEIGIEPQQGMSCEFKEHKQRGHILRTGYIECGKLSG